MFAYAAAAVAVTSSWETETLFANNKSLSPPSKNGKLCGAQNVEEQFVSRSVIRRRRRRRRGRRRRKRRSLERN